MKPSYEAFTQLFSMLCILRSTCENAMYSFFTFLGPQAVNQEQIDLDSGEDSFYRRLSRSNPQSIYGFEPPKDWLAVASKYADAIGVVYWEAFGKYQANREFLLPEYALPAIPREKADQIFKQQDEEASSFADKCLASLSFNTGVMESEAEPDYNQRAIDALDWTLGELEARIPEKRVEAMLSKTFSLKDNDAATELPPILYGNEMSVDEAMSLLLKANDSYNPAIKAAEDAIVGELIGCSAMHTLIRKTSDKKLIAKAASALEVRMSDAVILASLEEVDVEARLDKINSTKPVVLKAKQLIWPNVKAGAAQLHQ